ncbi:MAG: histone deacetylase family protein [Nitrospinae bacterium]|nr:histone deacetylase family protein [Nitrospinota bacterium]
MSEKEKHAFIGHPDCLLHNMGSSHPESPKRLEEIEMVLKKSALWNQFDYFEAPFVDKSDLIRAHNPQYIKNVFRISPSEGTVDLDPDTIMNPHTLDAARRAAGAIVHANNLVFNKGYTTVFCNVRPPGHHAESDRAMGFCLFNNVVVGALNALKKHNVNKVAILDFDVHHGNGTEEMVDGKDGILFCSSFQHPFYPYSSPVSNNNQIIKSPLPSGANGNDFRKVVTEIWLPALNEFKPEIIYVSAGFDAHKEDYLASLNFLEEDYHWFAKEVKEVAKKYCQGRIISTLEGGYNLSSLSQSVAAYLEAITTKT